MDQAQPTGEHRIYAQTYTCTNSSFGFFSSLLLIIFLCSSIRLTQLILLQRRFFRPRYIGDDIFLGLRYIEDAFFFYLGPIVLQGRNKKVIFGVIFKLDSYFFIKIQRLFLVLHSDCPFYAETQNPFPVGIDRIYKMY